MDLCVIFRYTQKNYRVRYQLLSEYSNICARVCPNSQVLVAGKATLKEKLCAIVMVFYLQQNLFEQQSQEGGKKRELLRGLRR